MGNYCFRGQTGFGRKDDSSKRAANNNRSPDGAFKSHQLRAQSMSPASLDVSRTSAAADGAACGTGEAELDLATRRADGGVSEREVECFFAPDEAPSGELIPRLSCHSIESVGVEVNSELLAEHCRLSQSPPGTAALAAPRDTSPPAPTPHHTTHLQTFQAVPAKPATENISPSNDVILRKRNANSPTSDVISPKRDVTSPKRDVSSPDREIISPNRAIDSPTRDVSSPTCDVTPVSKKTHTEVFSFPARGSGDGDEGHGLEAPSGVDNPSFEADSDDEGALPRAVNVTFTREEEPQDTRSPLNSSEGREQSPTHRPTLSPSLTHTPAPLYRRSRSPTLTNTPAPIYSPTHSWISLSITQADRELGEITAELETIEERLIEYVSQSDRSTALCRSPDGAEAGGGDVAEGVAEAGGECAALVRALTAGHEAVLERQQGTSMVDQSTQTDMEEPIQAYDKAISTLTTETVAKLLRHRSYGGVECDTIAILREHKQRQEELRAHREAETQRLLEKLQMKIKARQQGRLIEKEEVKTNTKDDEHENIYIEMEIAKMQDGLLETLRENESDQDEMYADLLDSLRMLCTRTGDFMRGRKGEGSQLGDDWLNLPDMADLDVTYRQRSDRLRAHTADELLDAQAACSPSQIEAILRQFRDDQRQLYHERAVARQQVLEVNEVAPKQVESTVEFTDTMCVMRDNYIDVLRERETESLSTSETESSSEASESEDKAEDIPARAALRTTLHEDMLTNLTSMTENDFTQLMQLYRREQSQLHQLRQQEGDKHQQSLWQKLQRRKMADIDEGHVENNDDVTTGVDMGVGSGSVGTSEMAMGTEGLEGGSPREVPSREEGTSGEGGDMEGEAECRVGEYTEGLVAMDAQLLAASPRHSLKPNQLRHLLDEHYSNSARLRQQRYLAKMRAQVGAQSRVRRRKQEREEKALNGSRKSFSSSSSSDDEVTKPDESDHEQEDEEVEAEEEGLRAQYQARVGEEPVAVAAVEELLAAWRRDQTALARAREEAHRQAQRGLEGKIQERRRQREAREQGSDLKEQTLQQMDEGFYNELVERQGRGEISGDDLKRLVEQHLNRLDELRKRTDTELGCMRRDRRREAARQRASQLVREDAVRAAELRDLRQAERQRTTARLQERLRHGQQKAQQPDKPPRAAPLPPRRQPLAPPAPDPRHSPRPARHEPHPTSYENVHLPS